MYRFFYFVLFFLLTKGVTFSSPITIKIPLPPFSSLRCQGNGKIEIMQGKENALFLSGNKKNREKISCKVEKGTLTLYSTLLQEESPQIDIKFIIQSLYSITLDGCFSIDIDQMKGEKLFIGIKGQRGLSSLEGTVYLDHLALAIEQQSLVSLRGSAHRQTVFITGKGIYDGQFLLSEKAKIYIEAAAVACIHAKNNFIATGNSGGRLYSFGILPTFKKGNNNSNFFLSSSTVREAL